jgi:hypothetical protein
MAAWVHTNYLISGLPAVDWSDASFFLSTYQDTAYWWTAHAENDYDVQWNNACAIYLIIQKCNALQTQVDAMSGGDVDMDSILSAMISASFAQLQKFIGLVDAYRMAIWNAPFNAEFYASLARGFQQWP